MSKDYYKILDVDKNASQDDIKKAFRKLAHKYHPDKAGGDEEKFKEINEANQVLGDPQKRKQYDQFGSAGFNGFAGGTGAGFNGQGFGFSAQGFEDLGDMFGDMFGGGFGFSRQKKQTPRGQDIQVDMDLTFKESIFGATKDISVVKSVSCQRCAGTAAEPGEGVHTCGECNGSGMSTQAHRTILGMMQSKKMCTTCNGSGDVPKKKCIECSGAGVVKEKSTITVTIPGGVDNGSILRVRGEGEAVRSGESGDFFVKLHVETDSYFKRVGFDLHTIKQIGFTQAALGDKLDIKTVDGIVEFKIPSGTQSGTSFRLSGKGVVHNIGIGDQIVTIIVNTPTKLSKKQKELLKDLDLSE